MTAPAVAALPASIGSRYQPPKRSCAHIIHKPLSNVRLQRKQRSVPRQREREPSPGLDAQGKKQPWPGQRNAKNCPPPWSLPPPSLPPPSSPPFDYPIVFFIPPLSTPKRTFRKCYTPESPLWKCVKVSAQSKALAVAPVLWARCRWFCLRSMFLESTLARRSTIS